MNYFRTIITRRSFWVGVGVESCKIVFLDGHFLFTSSDTFVVGFNSLATMHSVTDRRTDRQTVDIIMPCQEHGCLGGCIG